MANTPPKDSAWLGFGMSGDDTGNYINQFTSTFGLGEFQDNEAYLRQIFNKFDKDGSGKIDASELNQALTLTPGAGW